MVCALTLERVGHKGWWRPRTVISRACSTYDIMCPAGSGEENWGVRKPAPKKSQYGKYTILLCFLTPQILEKKSLRAGGDTLLLIRNATIAKLWKPSVT